MNGIGKFMQVIKIIDPTINFSNQNEDNQISKNFALANTSTTTKYLQCSFFSSANNTDKLPRVFRVGDIIRINRCYCSVFRSNKILQGNIDYGTNWILFKGATEDAEDECNQQYIEMRAEENNSSNIECDLNINSFFGMPTSPPKLMVPKPILSSRPETNTIRAFDA